MHTPSTAEKMAEYRRKRKAKGHVMTQIWLRPDEHAVLKQIIENYEFPNQSEAISHALRETFINRNKGAAQA